MIRVQDFFETIRSQGTTFFCGVPDSLLSPVSAYLADQAAPNDHTIAVNEGQAVALAAGSYLATGKIGMCYLQNSGVGNMVNPLLSLLHPDVYGIPLLLLVGWRGKPGLSDEPQHIPQGTVTQNMLRDVGVETQVMPEAVSAARLLIAEAYRLMQQEHRPYALLVPPRTFAPYESHAVSEATYTLSREQAIDCILQTVAGQDIVVAATGMIGREVSDLREKKRRSQARDILNIGAMGHTSALALGIARERPHDRIYCLDGDGAVLMHMGALATIGTSGQANFYHMVLNNGAHDSVGGQPTVAFAIDIPAIATACGYKKVYTVTTEQALKDVLSEIHQVPGPVLVEVRVKKGARDSVGRPTSSPIERKQAFMRSMQEEREPMQ